MTPGSAAPAEMQYESIGRGRSIATLTFFIVSTFTVQALQSFLRRRYFDVSWYGEAVRTPWHPPDWVNGTAWTAALIFAAVAAWLAWRESGRRERAMVLALFWSSVLLNAVWPLAIFAFYPAFGSLALWLGLALMALLAFTNIGAAAQYRRIYRGAGTLMLVPVVWTLFAASVVAGLALLN